MGDNAFWIWFWGLLAGTICAIAFAIAADDIYGTRKVVEMVRDGANPAAARCAVFGSGMNNVPDCNLVGQNR